MSNKDKRKYVGKIGYCDNKDLGISHTGGHYVYINKYDSKRNLYKVNIVTSLEDKKSEFSNSKLNNVKKGYTYPIPKKDADFALWSGVTNNPKFVHISKIKTIGSKRIKNRHKFFLGKFF